MAAKYTPGPWRLLDDAGHPANIRIGSTRRPHVAKVYAESLDRDPNCEANARLIASAPDLLEALKDSLASLIAAISLLERGSKKAAPSDKMFDQMLADYQASADRARAAIRQAEGGE